jgi:CDP-diacylglycerol--glycerol-3-phosphate 3-phosphatidyltransferase
MPDGVRRLLPNAITVIRLGMATAFFAIIALKLSPDSADGRQWWGNAAFVLFIAAALSDILDGFLARRWGVVTDFGRVMDPFVDKVLVLGAFVYLASPKFAEPEWSRAFGIEPAAGEINCATGVASWMVVAVLARELLVTSLRGVLEARGIAFAADWSGKVKMFAQSAAIPTALFIAVNPGCLASPGYRLAQTLSVWAMTIVTIWSAVPYTVRGAALLRSISKGTGGPGR